MTVSYLHAVWTVLLLAVFAGIAFWAFRKSNRARFEEAGRIPLEDDQPESGRPAPGGRTQPERSDG